MTASKENCKRLYELSGWKDCWYAWEETKTNGVCLVNTTYDRATTGGNRTPAYDLGFLLRKLPFSIMFSPYKDGYNLNCIALDIRGPGLQSSYDTQADTPENCLALLAIKLFEEAVL